MFAIHQGSWARIGGLVLAAIFFTWAVFRLFPDAPNVVAVFVALFGVLWMIFKEPGNDMVKK